MVTSTKAHPGYLLIFTVGYKPGTIGAKYEVATSVIGRSLTLRMLVGQISWLLSEKIEQQMIYILNLTKI